MNKVCDVLNFLEELAPYSLAEKWDNCGLLVGNKNDNVKSVLIALDVTQNVIDEAINTDCNLIIAHHPMIFTSISAISYDDYVGKMIITAIKNDISIICMHTNLDSADEGVNTFLAKKLGLLDIENFGAGESLQMGRVGFLDNPMKLLDFVDFVKATLGANGIKFVGDNDVQKVSVLGGAGGKLIDLAIKNGSDTYVTSDCSYDIMQKASNLGVNLIDAGHFATENVICEALLNKITENFNFTASISKTHHDIINFR